MYSSQSVLGLRLKYTFMYNLTGPESLLRLEMAPEEILRKFNRFK